MTASETEPSTVTSDAAWKYINVRRLFIYVEQSIDYGVLEKAENVAVVAGEFGWDDIGSWAALLRLGPADADGNVVRGRVLALSSRGNLVASDTRLVALVGVEGLVVIDTEDAVLVCSADRVQDVKGIIDELHRRGWKEHL